MEKFRGILEIRHYNEGSRAEGDIAFLVMEDGSEVELCRAGGVPLNDPYYEPYADATVEIEGEISHGFLVVETISTLEIEDEEAAEEAETEAADADTQESEV